MSRYAKRVLREASRKQVWNPEAPMQYTLGDFPHSSTPEPDPPGSDHHFSNVILGVLSVFILTFVVIALAFAVLGATPARSHDAAHPHHNDWFAEQRNAAGVPCCDGMDARRLDDVDWDTSCNGSGCHYRVRLDGKWVDVPDGQVIKGPNKAGYPFVTIFKGRLNCFMPGGGT